MKIKLWLVVLPLIFVSCVNKKERSPSKKDIGIALAFILGCKYSSTNPLFPDVYYDHYSSNRNQYKTLILGDSTMDIACNSFVGYSGEAGCFPVSGNKIPDFQSQLCVLSTINPSYVVVSTMGGNDLLSQTPNDEIIRRGFGFVDALNAKYPNATKVFIQVHPTRVDYANENRGKTNSAISSYAISKSWKVVDPDSCFVVDGQGRALQSYLLDAIHPNQSSSNCIKSKVISECGVVY